MESKIQKSLIQTNIKNILLAIAIKTYLDKDEVYNFINNMIEENKYCINVMKKHFNKELLMTKEDNYDFKNYTKCGIFDNHYDIYDYDYDYGNDVKARDYCHITGKYRCFAHRDCNVNLKLNHKIHVVFHNLKSYDSYLIMQELGKFNLKINVIPNGLEKYMSFTINNKLSFTDSFQFISSSLHSLGENLCKDDFKYLSQEIDNNVLDLVKQKGFE